MKTSKVLKLTLLLILIGTAVCHGQSAKDNGYSPLIDPDAPFDSAAFFKTFKSRFDSTNGIRMHYIIGGSGHKVIVLLHGFPENGYTWRKILPALAMEYTVIAPDMRGFGLTDKPPTGYDKKDLANDIHGLIHKLGYHDIYIAGHDFGGPVAFSYTCQYPDEVKKLVLMECGGMAGYGLEKLMDITHGGIWHFGFFATPKIPELLIRGREKEFFTAFSFHDSLDGKPIFQPADIDHYLTTLSAPDGLNGLFEYYRTYPQDVKNNRVFAKTKISVPVLAIDGLLKGMTKSSIMPLAASVSGEVIPNTGHWLQEERPNELLAQMIPFFHADSKNKIDR